MRNLALLFSVLFIAVKLPNLQAQTDGKVKLMKLYAQEWGFLTYYTSAPEKNENAWFDNLVKGLRIINSDSSLKKFEELTDTLLSRVKTQQGKPVKINTEEDTLLNPNLFKWLDDPVFSKTRGKFIQIKEHPNSVYSCFRPLQYRDEGVKLSDEKRKNIPNVNNNFDALAGFIVLWNAANYYSAYPIGKKYNWDNLLDEYIPEFLKLRRSDPNFYIQYGDLIHQITARLEDSHTLNTIVGTQGNIQVDIVDSLCYVTKIHPKLKELLGINPGDIILERNGVPFKQMYHDLKKSTGGSHPLVIERNMLPVILKFSNPVTRLKVKNHERTFDVELNYDVFEQIKANDTIKEFKNWRPNYFIAQRSDTIFSDSIGYVNISIQKTRKSLIRSLKAVKEKKYLILDFRGYPYTVFAFRGSKKRIIYTEISCHVYFSNDRINKPGYFKKAKGLPPTFISNPGLINSDKYCKGKTVYLLCNEYSQSRSELSLMHYQAMTDGIVVGRNTAGVPNTVGYIYLPGMIYTMFTAGEKRDYKGRLITGPGITPDIYVKKDIEKIISGRDYILEKALESIRDSKGKVTK